MKSKYRRFNLYLVDECKKTLLNAIQQDMSLRTEIPMFYRGWYLMKLKRNNINKAMKRLQLYKARNVVIDPMVARMITEEYNAKNV